MKLFELGMGAVCMLAVALWMAMLVMICVWGLLFLLVQGWKMVIE